MEPLTHLTSGALGACAARRPSEGRYIILFSIAAAWLPDIDNLAGFFGPELYLIHHRGITHSILGGFVLSCLLVAIFRLFIKSFPIKRGLAISYLLILVHIFLDLITSYGTQIFYPITNMRYSVASVFIIDPFYTLIMVTILCFSLLTKKNKKKFAMLGFVWLFLYPMINLGIRHIVQYRVENRLKGNKAVFNKVHILPDALAPVFWKVIVEDNTSYQIGGLSLLDIDKPIDYKEFKRAEPDLFKRFGKHASIFNTYFWFAGYPIMKTKTSDKGVIITFGDLRFSSTVEFVRNLLKNKQVPFSLTAILDQNHKIAGYYYFHHGKTRIIQQLE